MRRWYSVIGRLVGLCFWGRDMARSGPKPKTTERFIEQARVVHGNKYDYSETLYKTSNQMVLIICYSCGQEFEQVATEHLRGRGCNRCWIDSLTFTTEGFIDKARQVHGDRYDYSKVIYKNSQTKISIHCFLCDTEFNQRPNDHLKGKGCPKCAVNLRTQSQSHTTEFFIKKAQIVHGQKYDYSQVSYKNNHTPVTIICIKHGEFSQVPYSHLLLNGCPSCSSSRGEECIVRFLDELGISYIQQKRFNKCRDTRLLPFDFYLQKYSILIEYDGEQHFIAAIDWGGEEALKKVQRRDAIKTKFAHDNGFVLIRISYTVKNIKAYLQFELEKYLPFSIDQLKNQPERPQAKIKPINPYQWRQGVLL